METIIRNFITANSDLTVLLLASILQALLVKFHLLLDEKSATGLNIPAFIIVIMMMINQTFMICVSAWCIMEDVTSGMAWTSLFLSFVLMLVVFVKIKLGKTDNK